MVYFFLSFFFLQLLSFLQGLFTFYHEGYELAQEFAPYKQQLQFNLQNVRLYLFHRLSLVSQMIPGQLSYSQAELWRLSKTYLSTIKPHSFRKTT